MAGPTCLGCTPLCTHACGCQPAGLVSFGSSIHFFPLASTRSQLAPPVIFLWTSLSLPPAAPQLAGASSRSTTAPSAPSPPYVFYREVLLRGPFNHDPAYAREAVLDLGQQWGVMQLAANGSLFVEQLVRRPEQLWCGGLDAAL